MLFVLVNISAHVCVGVCAHAGAHAHTCPWCEGLKLALRVPFVFPSLLGEAGSLTESGAFQL